ncbi:hypothetical protein AGMMS49975_07320 [Clostridia bacterium]|nr:hypothetical protein AGMMS49975_07320 [Clostridia bacterium]
MKKERLLILELLADGKISADEAARLLDSLKRDAREWDCDDANEKIKDFSRSVEGFAKDFSAKLETSFKIAEPKLRKTTKIALEKTAQVIDNISKSLNESIRNFEAQEAARAEAEQKEDVFGEKPDDAPREN